MPNPTNATNQEDVAQLHATIGELHKALERIAAGAYTCNACGVEYVEGYEGPCQEPREDYTVPLHGELSNRYIGPPRRCAGHVDARGTARYVLNGLT